MFSKLSLQIYTYVASLLSDVVEGDDACDGPFASFEESPEELKQ